MNIEAGAFVRWIIMYRWSSFSELTSAARALFRCVRKRPHDRNARTPTPNMYIYRKRDHAPIKFYGYIAIDWLMHQCISLTIELARSRLIHCVYWVSASASKWTFIHSFGAADKFIALAKSFKVYYYYYYFNFFPVGVAVATKRFPRRIISICSHTNWSSWLQPSE